PGFAPSIITGGASRSPSEPSSGECGESQGAKSAQNTSVATMTSGTIGGHRRAGALGAANVWGVAIAAEGGPATGSPASATMYPSRDSARGKADARLANHEHVHVCGARGQPERECALGRSEMPRRHRSDVHLSSERRAGGARSRAPVA